MKFRSIYFLIYIPGIILIFSAAALGQKAIPDAPQLRKDNIPD
jgi:hypothetical protein